MNKLFFDKAIPTAPIISTEETFYIKNVINPPFAADMKSYLTIITIDNFKGSDVASGLREKENILFTDFSAFSAGSVSNVNVFANRYESNMPNVEYNWVSLHLKIPFKLNYI